MNEKIIQQLKDLAEAKTFDEEVEAGLAERDNAFNGDPWDTYMGGVFDGKVYLARLILEELQIEC